MSDPPDYEIVDDAEELPEGDVPDASPHRPTPMEVHLVAALASALSHLDRGSRCNATRVIENALRSINAMPTKRTKRKAT